MRFVKNYRLKRNAIQELFCFFIVVIKYVNLKKDLKNADKKNITTYRSNSSFNILKKAS